MKIHSVTLLATLCVLLTACSGSKSTKNEVVNLPIAGNIGAEVSPALKVNGLTHVRLASDTADAFFQDASILGVIGDTVVLVENTPGMSRLIMFDAADGRYIGQINHRGQGPGEYSAIVGAFVNPADATVLLPNFDRPSVYRYSLATDSLLATIQREPSMTMIPPVGGTTTCINVAVPTPEGVVIRQYDAGYQRIDSISLPGFQGGNFNMVWGNAGADGIFMIADTLYTLTPGALRPAAILSRGDYALTNDADRDITMKVMTTGEDEKELLKPYILVRDVQITGGRMLVTTMQGGVKHSDLYDLTDGRLLYRNTYTDLSIPSSIEIEDGSGRIIRVERLFATDGRWYALVSDESDPDAASSNSALVTFTL